MSLTGLGDRAQLFLSQRQNADIRTRLAARTQELTSGEAGDMVAHLGGSTASLADLDRRLALAESYGYAAREAGNRLTLMQDVLGQVEDLRAGVAADLMKPEVVGDVTIAASAARAGFEDVVSALNARLGDSSLFAGTKTDGPALASAQAMLDGIRTAVAGSTTAAEVSSRLDTWFDGSSSAFALDAYQGSDASLARPVDAGTTVTFGIRADDPTLRALMKATALSALAQDPALSLPAAESKDLLTRSRDALLSLSAPLTMVRADLGHAQGRVEEAAARHVARATAWGLMRNEMTQVDPYDTATEIEALRTQLETHYEMTSRLSSLNLMSFLR